MKISEIWLRELVQAPVTSFELASQLTMAGLEVDGIFPVAGDFSKVVVAHVVSTTPHPQADKLSLCEVDAGGNDLVKIVCGASNVRAGLKVALAQVGAILPGGMKIKEAKLRGETSLGMLCSCAELGIEDSFDGIMELPDDAPIGNDLREYMKLDDKIFDVDLTPNRADCFSVIGIAREVCALNRLEIKPIPNVIGTIDLDDEISIKIKEQESCPNYCGRIIRKINASAITPLWLKERLRRAGIRPIHPVVDITNYVMIELGQPMHAFDLHKINGSITVRNGNVDERLILLDGKEITLSDSTLVIADDEKVLAIAGVMGGESSSVTDTTTDIFLESAFFSPVNIAGVARRFGLSTDSSQRFERGVDPTIQALAMERATSLLLEIVGGVAGPITVVNSESTKWSQKSISFNPEIVERITGIEISATKMLATLTALGMQVDADEVEWKVAAPPYRFDISLDVDLVEEIIRLHGYDNIAVRPMQASLQAGEINGLEMVSRRIANYFASRGYNETITYSFVDPGVQEIIYPDADGFKLLNPISSELSTMRAGLWPGLLASMIHNIHRQQTVVKLFECGVAFDVSGSDVLERHCVAGLISGDVGFLNWSETSRKFDFYDVKGDLAALFAMLEQDNIKYVPTPHPGLHPGQSARVFINDEPVGWVGVLHPRLAESLGVVDDVVLFEMNLHPLISHKPPKYTKISKYPKIRRDLSLLVDNSISISMIEDAVREVVELDWLKSFDVFDLYAGKSIPFGKKSIAIALTLQDNNRTLVDDEINTLIGAIIRKLDKDFAISLRD